MPGPVAAANPPPPILQTQTQPPPIAAPAPATPPAPNLPAGDRIVIKATADAWVTVKQPGGPALLSKLMHGGDTWPVPAGKTGLTLTTGNAGGTEIDVDGAVIPVSLGGSGMVRRDLPLDADALKSGHIPPPPARGKPRPALPPAPDVTE